MAPKNINNHDNSRLIVLPNLETIEPLEIPDDDRQEELDIVVESMDEVNSDSMDQIYEHNEEDMDEVNSDSMDQIYQAYQEIMVRIYQPDQANEANIDSINQLYQANEANIESIHQPYQANQANIDPIDQLYQTNTNQAAQHQTEDHNQHHQEDEEKHEITSPNYVFHYDDIAEFVNNELGETVSPEPLLDHYYFPYEQIAEFEAHNDRNVHNISPDPVDDELPRNDNNNNINGDIYNYNSNSNNHHTHFFLMPLTDFLIFIDSENITLSQLIYYQIEIVCIDNGMVVFVIGE